MGKLPKIVSEQISNDDSPSEVDVFLNQRYKRGLYQFSKCLVDIFYLNYILNSLGGRANSLAEVPKKIDKLKRSITKTISNFEPDVHILLDIDIKNLAPFYRELEQLASLAELLNRDFIRKRGRQLNPKNLVLLIWSYYMTDPENHLVERNLIIDLFQWHYEIIDNPVFKKLLEDDETEMDIFTTKREINRLRKKLEADPKLKQYIDFRKDEYFPIEDKTIRTTIDIPALFGIGHDTSTGEEAPEGEEPEISIIYSKEKYLKRNLP